MTPRTLRPRPSAFLITVALAGLALSACAATGLPSRTEDLAKLNADCEARGGILTPTGQVSGREQLDNYCRITSGPSDRIRPPG